MELRQYIQIMRRRKWVVIITITVTLLVVGGVSLLMEPTYSASATIRIAQVQDRFVDYRDLNYSMRVINTYIELVRSGPFLAETIRQLELDIYAADLAKLVKVESIPGTELLKITAENRDPATAMLVANTLGELLMEEGESLYSGQGKSAREILLDQLLALETELNANREHLRAIPTSEVSGDLSPETQDLQTQIELQEQIYATVLDAYENARLSDVARANSVSIVDPAIVPENPSQPNIPINVLLGTLIGLAGGIGLAFLLENLDASIYSPEDLEDDSQVPLLASISELRVPASVKDTPFILQPNGKSAAAEAFRLLRSNVLTSDYGRPPKSMLITSVEPGAGKTTVLANLAAALGQAGRSVVIVDSDLRNPSLDKIFRISNNIGLKDVIAGDETLESAIQQTKVEGVNVLPSGQSTHNPAEQIGLPSMRQIVEDLANWADFVLLDSPPLLQYADALMLAPHVDGIALVVSRGGVTGDQVQKVLARLSTVGAEQVGFVFNKAEAHQLGY